MCTCSHSCIYAHNGSKAEISAPKLRAGVAGPAAAAARHGAFVARPSVSAVGPDDRVGKI